MEDFEAGELNVVDGGEYFVFLSKMLRALLFLKDIEFFGVCWNHMFEDKFELIVCGEGLFNEPAGVRVEEILYSLRNLRFVDWTQG